jgi:hypothetical protein
MRQGLTVSGTKIAFCLMFWPCNESHLYTSAGYLKALLCKIVNYWSPGSPLLALRYLLGVKSLPTASHDANKKVYYRP